MNPKHWSVEQVLEWLKSLKINNDYVPTFKFNKINGLALESLTHEVLFFELGIYSYEDRSTILYHLRKLTASCNSLLKMNDYYDYDSAQIGEKRSINQVSLGEEYKISGDLNEQSYQSSYARSRYVDKNIGARFIANSGGTDIKKGLSEKNEKRRITPITVPLPESRTIQIDEKLDFIDSEDETLPYYGSSEYDSDEYEEAEKLQNQIDKDNGMISKGTKVLSKEEKSKILKASLNRHCQNWRNRFNPANKKKSFFNNAKNPQLLKDRLNLFRQQLDNQIDSIISNDFTQISRLEFLLNQLETSVFSINDCNWLLKNPNIEFCPNKFKPAPQLSKFSAKLSKLSTSETSHNQYIYEDFCPEDLFSDNDDYSNKTLLDYIEKNNYYSNLDPEVKQQVDDILNDQIDQANDNYDQLSQNLIKSETVPTSLSQIDTSPNLNLPQSSVKPESLSSLEIYQSYLKEYETNSNSDGLIGPVIKHSNDQNTSTNYIKLPGCISDNNSDDLDWSSEDHKESPELSATNPSQSNCVYYESNGLVSKGGNSSVNIPDPGNNAQVMKKGKKENIPQQVKHKNLIDKIIYNTSTKDLWYRIKRIRKADLVQNPHLYNDELKALSDIYYEYTRANEAEISITLPKILTNSEIPTKFIRFHEFKKNQIKARFDCCKSLTNDSEESGSDFLEYSDVDKNIYHLKRSYKGRRNIRHINGDMTSNQIALTFSRQFTHNESFEKFTKEQSEFIQGYLSQKVRETLKPHQTDGIEFMWNNLIIKKSGCILAQTMGLGKSLQVILLLDALFKAIDSSSIPGNGMDTFYKRAIIICPAYLQQNWVQEFQKWKPLCQFNCKIISLLDKKSGNKYTKLQTWKDNGDIIITSFNTFTSFLKPNSKIQFGNRNLDIKEALFDPGPSIVVVDEAHVIKSETTQFYQALSNLKTRLRICLTGHPLQNSLLEYYNMIDFATPGLLSKKEDFCNQFKNPIENGFYLDSKESDKALSEQQLGKLTKIIKPCVFRLGNQVLDQYIPPKIEFDISIKLSKLQRQVYNRFLIKLKQEKSGNVLANSNASLIICNHPLIMKSNISSLDISEPKELMIDDQDETIERAQVAWLKEIFSEYSVELLSQENISLKFEICLFIIFQSIIKREKLLIFSRSIPTLKFLQDYLNQKINKDFIYYMAGDTSLKTKMDLVNCFNMDINPSVFLISVRSGSYGINLHSASRVILFDIGWNPSIDEQAIGRCYRLGQTRPVVVYRLRTSNTLEDELYPINQKKKTMFQKVIDQEDVYHMFNKTKGDYFCIYEDEITQIKGNHEFNDDIIKNLLEKHSSSIVDMKLA
ncbi:hypothetical protein CONCODRAFT_6367 [Conidiobolus coronatus NRRL 28638]|uniref:P-loop containing nucleoside triphosphate hydrolase protein n=1 Tax=Conidiobolus coronatus (strain ATCC 28846 / CBS 209.66 / NRRL 28638) TaxID=796925 RepID=A0A137P7S6_CONC2|nr:hypothetical protein CONCODRAFT_6367 [Conidiobolus coronatus NRRL 28638]|eukprot:KXN70994.1 hypothetical protein CONCODRAFT_6367 [Conidiobolus coronatus NRRL 28638]